MRSVSFAFTAFAVSMLSSVASAQEWQMTTDGFEGSTTIVKTSFPLTPAVTGYSFRVPALGYVVVKITKGVTITMHAQQPTTPPPKQPEYQGPGWTWARTVPDDLKRWGPQGSEKTPANMGLVGWSPKDFTRENAFVGQLIVGFDNRSCEQLNEKNWKRIFAEGAPKTFHDKTINVTLAEYRFTPNESGYMYFGMNDGVKNAAGHWGYGDNIGYVTVIIDGVQFLRSSSSPADKENCG